VSMYSGPQALTSIDESLRETRHQLQSLGQRIDESRRDVVQTRSLESQAYQALAGARLEQLEDGSLYEEFDTAYHRAGELLEERDEALADVHARLEENERQQTSLEHKRQEQTQLIGEQAERLDALQAQAQGELETDPHYQARLTEVEKARNIVQHAEEKVTVAEEDRAEKGKPFESEPLFMYLWKRGYGTSEYSAGKLARLLDRWVAMLCGYNEARPNFARLLEIPKRLEEHAEARREELDAELMKLEMLEEEIAQKHGVPALQDKLDQERVTLDEIDQSIGKQEKRYQALLDKKAAFEAGKDVYYQQAVDVLVKQLQREPLPELLRDAQSTPSREDDTWVRSIAEAQSRQAELKLYLDEQQEVHSQYVQRLQELEDIRRRFKGKRFDAANSGFPDSGTFSRGLGDFLGGILSSRQFWRLVLSQQGFQIPKSRQVFGSGGFGRPNRGRVWRNSGFGHSRGGSRGGSRSGGGFRTGGGF